MSLPLGNLPDTRYPDPRIERLDPRFVYKQGNAAIERIATGFRWAEGPVYFRDGGYLIFSDIPNNRMMRWLEEDGHLSVFRAPVELRQRQHPRPRGSADHLRARHTPRHAHRIGRTHHRADRSFRRQAVERAERRRGGERRRGVVHRSGLRHRRPV